MGKIISSIVGGIGNLIGLGGGDTKAPETPAMPDPGSVEAKLAAQRRVSAKSKSGRAGTIYSGDSGPYTGSNLGGTG